MITAALPSLGGASILAADEEVEGIQLLLPAGYDILWSTVVLVVIGVVFYKLPGMAFALFGRDDLADDARHPIDGTFSGITLACNQRTEADVDAVLAQAAAAGECPGRQANKPRGPSPFVSIPRVSARR